MKLLSSASLTEKIWRRVYFVLCVCIFIFLVGPLFVVVPLSFNAQPYFTFTKDMLAMQPDAYSLRWYKGFFTDSVWLSSIINSFIIAIFSTVVATFLGVCASIGLSSRYMPWRNIIMNILISPMIVPLIISAAAMFFFYSRLQLAQTFVGVILAHAALGTPFVIITVTATLSSFDQNLIRAAYSLGAKPVYTFFHVVFPLVLPGVISGALFAFITSFDEVVVVLFLAGPEQRTVPLQMWAGLREQISPTILAVATMLVFLSIVLLSFLEYIRRRTEKIRGVTPV